MAAVAAALWGRRDSRAAEGRLRMASAARARAKQECAAPLASSPPLYRIFPAPTASSPRRHGFRVFWMLEQAMLHARIQSPPCPRQHPSLLRPADVYGAVVVLGGRCSRMEGVRGNRLCEHMVSV